MRVKYVYRSVSTDVWWRVAFAWRYRCGKSLINQQILNYFLHVIINSIIILQWLFVKNYCHFLSLLFSSLKHIIHRGCPFNQFYAIKIHFDFIVFLTLKTTCEAILLFCFFLTSNNDSQKNK